MLKNKLNFHKNDDFMDDRFFVDYNLINSCEGFDGETAVNNIAEFMQFNLELFLTGKRYQVAKNFSEFSEVDFYPSLGFARSAKKGRGVRPKSFIEILDLIAYRENAASIINGNIFAPVLVDNYGEDRNSDFLIKLMLPQISEYTKKVAIENSLETTTIVTKTWDCATNNWVSYETVLAKYPSDLVFRLIVPEDMLTYKLPYNPNDFICTYWRTIVNYSRENSDLKPYTQEEFRKFIKSEYGTYHEYILHIVEEMSDAELLGYMPQFRERSKINRSKKNKKD